MQKDVVLNCDYTVMYDDINNKLEMTNIALLKYLEEPRRCTNKKCFWQYGYT